ncbi:MAG: sensor histidine kinase [Thermoanaerobaculia bacterium]
MLQFPSRHDAGSFRLKRPNRRSLFWILQASGWGLFGAAMVAAGLSQWTTAYTLLNKSSLTVLGFAVTLGLRLAYRSGARRGLPVPALVASAIPVSFAGAGVWMAAQHFVLEAFGRRAPDSLARAAASFPDFLNTIYYFFLLLAWSALYFGIPAYLDLLEQRERALRAESLAHAARLRALRFQLNPHFLFNTLNAISTLVADSRGPEANRMLSRLGDFLRATLERPECEEIPLAEEIDFARQYLEIEEIRFGERLKVAIAMDPGTGDALVPPMILQPLVENAVRHGVQVREAGGSISVAARRQDGCLVLDVEDDGPGLSIGEPPRAGVGLSNTRTRLLELYGSDAELRLGRSARGGMAVSVRLPWRHSPAEG